MPSALPLAEDSCGMVEFAPDTTDVLQEDPETLRWSTLISDPIKGPHSLFTSSSFGTTGHSLVGSKARAPMDYLKLRLVLMTLQRLFA
ncbi:hypothetical protein Pmani_008435 [Petrolisthes manimaculis]|uniref:Uncharacterized protein n=1 Tax=Petrolisthes manimaculis TaxID=1843537 RepID=A0AAE1Q6P7_9EUCA|nr:hypothetical protein Pmani_008435 [Petrolisthes manimaculis]